MLVATSVLAQPPSDLWNQTYGGTNADYCASVLQTADSGFICAGYVLAGSTQSFGAGNADFWLVKTGPELVADEPRAFSPISFNLSCYPNLFNPPTTLAYDLPEAGHVSLRVFDLPGAKPPC